MATKKQKRAAAIAKHQQMMETYQQTGLEAQRKDREHREREAREEWRANHDKRHSWRKRIKECPLCKDEIKTAKQASPNLGEFADAAEGAKKDRAQRVELSHPQTGSVPDVDYGPTEDMMLEQRLNV